MRSNCQKSWIMANEKARVRRLSSPVAVGVVSSGEGVLALGELGKTAIGGEKVILARGEKGGIIPLLSGDQGLAVVLQDIGHGRQNRSVVERHLDLLAKVLLTLKIIKPLQRRLWQVEVEDAVDTRLGLGKNPRVVEVAEARAPKIVKDGGAGGGPEAGDPFHDFRAHQRTVGEKMGHGSGVKKERIMG